LVFICALSFIAFKYRPRYKISAALKDPNVGNTGAASSESSSLNRLKHVFVIVEENSNWQEILNNPKAPFINQTLLKKGAFAQNYRSTPIELGPMRPSEPNYILIQAGKAAFSDHIFTTNDDPSAVNSTASHDHLTYLIDQNNLSWKSYQEDITGQDCPIKKIKKYTPKHNPFVFFQDVSGNPPSTQNSYCLSHIRPLAELYADLSSGNLANYTFISPNLNNNMHDGTITQADAWLSKVISAITSSEIYKKDSVIFITWDESGGRSYENNPIGLIIISPYVRPGFSDARDYTHASLLKTIQEIFHLSPLLGISADEKTLDLSDFFQ